ncbi:MAG: hypothetical protein FJW39_24280 [Acidobacteria bacterium]|nr:hypothetical protein [Acidobacteriota bacterium]
MTVYFGEPSNRRFVTAGLDPGHANDYSALAVIECGSITDRLRAMVGGQTASYGNGVSTRDS